jgi:Ca2+-binding RTX toxin-like protein
VTSGVIALALGDGENTVSLGGVPAGYEAEITMGAGDDAITLTSAAGGDTLTVDMGDGENTINIEDDITDGTYDLDNVDIIDVNANVGTAVVGATELTGQSYLLKASGNITAGAFDEQLAVEIDATGTFDFSGLQLATTLADGIAGIAVTYTAAVDGNVTLTSGDDAYTGTAADDVVIGGAGDDVIDGDDGDDTITGGTGADAMTAGAGADVFIIAAGDSGTTDGTQDVIAEFKTAGVDKLKLGVDGTATNYTEVDLTSGAASTYADALTQANASMAADTDLVYVLIEDSTSTGGWDGTADGLLFVDTDGDNAADMMIELTGVLALTLAETDIIA